MKRSALFAVVVIAALGMAIPASASTITLEFTGAGIPVGDNGGQSCIGRFRHSGGSSSLAISTLIVSGDGLFHGTYAVTGRSTVMGLSFNTDASGQFVTIVGGVFGCATLLSCGDPLLFAPMAQLF